MRQARALPSPNEALYVEEIKFWLKAMQEHTEFIRAGLPVGAADFCEASGHFAAAFDDLLQKAGHLKSVKQSQGFVGEVLGMMREFEDFQRKVLAEMFRGKVRGTNFPFFLDHMLREAKCFEVFLGCMQEETGPVKSVSHTREIVVWLRFMADHTRLLAHYIDPSECRMLRMVEEFSGLFDSLVQEARDLASMLYRHKGEVKVFRRFLLDIRIDVQRLRDFNKMAEDLIRDCRLLGIIDTELAAHMKREAEHCLLKVALLEKEFLRHSPDEFQDDADDSIWEMETPEDGEEDESEEAACDLVRVEEDGETAMGREENTVAPLPEEEPVAVLEDEKEEPLCEMPDGGQTEVSVLPVMLDGSEKSEETTPKPIPAYIKPSEKKAAPRGFALSTPRERYDKARQPMPRPLGKAKK